MRIYTSIKRVVSLCAGVSASLSDVKKNNGEVDIFFCVEVFPSPCGGLEFQWESDMHVWT